MQKNLLDHVSTYDSLLKGNVNVPFLKQAVMGDEKWVLYNTVEWKRPWGKQNESSEKGLCGDRKKMAICKPRREALKETNPDHTLTFDFPASRTMRK